MSTQILDVVLSELRFSDTQVVANLPSEPLLVMTPDKQERRRSVVLDRTSVAISAAANLSTSPGTPTTPTTPTQSQTLSRSQSVSRRNSMLLAPTVAAAAAALRPLSISSFPAGLDFSQPQELPAPRPLSQRYSTSTVTLREQPPTFRERSPSILRLETHKNETRNLRGRVRKSLESHLAQFYKGKFSPALTPLC